MLIFIKISTFIHSFYYNIFYIASYYFIKNKTNNNTYSNYTSFTSVMRQRDNAAKDTSSASGGNMHMV